MKALLGKKLGMTQIFREGELIPVTVLQAGPCLIVQRRRKEKDGYEAVQLGFEPIEEKKLNKPLLGHFKKKNFPPMRYLKEVRVKEDEPLKEGEEVKVDVFQKGDLVEVSGISKGKGFQGVMKRYNFGGGPDSHGSRGWHRRPGSIGASAAPGRVWKGQKMPGRMGREKCTIRNLKVVDVIPEKNLILVKGAVPGAKGNVVLIKAWE